MKRSLKLIAVLLICLSLNSIVPIVSAESVLGDLDGDGKLTSVDARQVLRFSSGMDIPTEAQKTLSDMNGDGSITLEDVKLLMSVALDLASYEESLLRDGFPVSYVEYLSELHKLYPEWEFKPFITGLDWQDSIDGERDPHSQQLIENNVQSSYMCSCSSCKGVIQEAANWVSASEEAVKYYMDPRNFLNEQYIFQFESTAYDSSQTQSGVEAILKNTWMYNANITYLDGLGTEKTYKEDGKTVKYSEAILKAAKDSGMSAYYLASKIVQEVGSSSSANAGGSSGKNAPFYGIYNYYNIGAYTGVRDGLEWANGFMKTTRSATMYKTASTSAATVVTVPSNTEVYYIGTSGDFYRVSAIVSGTTYKGYIAKSNISAYTSYGRPWNTPQKTIYYGAQYIYDSFSEHQFTGYLQKFNVNPDSDNLYNHEYMANVRAAASEAYSTYKAYNSANILSTKKVFSIPVFKNMPGADLTREDAFKTAKTTVTVPSYTSTSVTLSWTAIANAEKYQVYKYDAAAGKYTRLATTADLTYTDSSLSAGDFPKYKVRAYYTNSDGETVYSSYSAVFEATVTPTKPTGLSLVSKSDNSVKIKWTAVDCTKYQVYRYDAISGSYKKIAETASTSYTDSTVDSGTAYKYKIRAYTTTSSRKFYSSYSSVLSVTTTGETATKSGAVSITDGYLNIRKSADTSATVVAQLSNGQAVTILGTTGDWYKVSFTLDGATVTGYAHADYIKVGSSSSSSTTGKEKCPYAEPTVTIREGDSGDSVRWVQWYLYKLDYLKESDIDGSFGPTTLSAVKKFQTDKKLDVDGLVGSGTRGALKSAYGA